MIELAGVAFGHDRNRPPLLDGVTMTAEPGQFVVIVGRAGTGKSTLLQLIAGILSPWSGDLRLAGELVSNLPRAQWQRRIAHVGPRPWLFDGTVEDNIRLWDEHLPDHLVGSALRDSCLAEALERRGADRSAMVETAGRNFSGGERKRLALARALARDPSVVLLDAALDGLDRPLARTIAANLRGRGITTIMATARWESGWPADAVLRIESGRLVPVVGAETARPR